MPSPPALAPMAPVSPVYAGNVIACGKQVIAIFQPVGAPTGKRTGRRDGLDPVEVTVNVHEEAPPPATVTLGARREATPPAA